MASVTIQVLDNAPNIVKGEVELLDGEGKLLQSTSELHLCRCGMSKNAPHCDGSHAGKFNSQVRAK